MTLSPGFRPSCMVLVWGLAAAGAFNSPRPTSANPQVPALMQRFLDRDEEKLTSYRALRRLEAHNDRYKKHGWLEAWTTLDPHTGFSYEIVSEGGSSYVRDKVLRKALEAEAGAYARSEMGAAALVPANYRFAQSAAAGGLVGIGLEPRRRESMLVQGTLYLTAEDADLVRIEGQLAKSPSFWTRRVDIVRRYRRIGTVRVPVATESTAQVLMAGQSTFAMQYEYASINGRDVALPQPRVSELPAATERRER